MCHSNNVVIYRVVFGPERMITIPPRHYCVIENPVVRQADGSVKKDASQQVKLSHADQEIRLAQDPFSLYPGMVWSILCCVWWKIVGESQ